MTLIFSIILSTACWADADLTQMYNHQQPTHQKMENDSFMTGFQDTGVLTSTDRNGQLSASPSLGYDAYASGLHADDPLPTAATASYDFPQHPSNDFSSHSDFFTSGNGLNNNNGSSAP